MAELSLFLSSLLAGSIFPASSEAALLYLINQKYSVLSLVIIATIGNSLGGASVYYIGRLGEYAKIERYLRIKPKEIEKYKDKVESFGWWSAFFSFLPIIGDLILLILGLCKANTLLTLGVMTAGKLFRYSLIAYYAKNLEQIAWSIFDFLT